MDFLLFNNTTDSIVKESRIGSIIISIIYILICSVGLLLHILVLIATIKKRHRKMNSFHIFLLNLCLSECLMYLLYFCYVIPCLLTNCEMSSIVVDIIAGSVETIDFIVISISTFFISCNRSLAISHSHINRTIFKKERSLIYCVTTWLFAIVIVVIDQQLLCQTFFVLEKYQFSLICDYHYDSLTLTSFCIYFFVYCVGLFYGYGLFHLRRLHRNCGDNEVLKRKMHQHKKRLFYQSFAIWLSLLINVLCKCSLIMIVSRVSTSVKNTFSFSNCSTHFFSFYHFCSNWYCCFGTKFGYANLFNFIFSRNKRRNVGFTIDCKVNV